MAVRVLDRRCCRRRLLRLLRLPRVVLVLLARRPGAFDAVSIDRA